MTGPGPRHAAPDPDETVIMPRLGGPVPHEEPEDPYAGPTRHLPVDPDATMIIAAVPAGEAPATMGAAPAGSPVDIDSAAELPARDQTGDLGGSVARNSALMAVLSIVSRATGLLRTAAIGAAIGAGLVADSYTIANTLPNMVYELLLGGVLASVVVPLLVRARTRDTDKGEAYAQRLFTLATVFLGAATLLAVAMAPLFTLFFTSDNTSPATSRLITTLSYLLLPEIFFYGMAALFAALLNTRGHFAAPMWTPILNNLIVIATAGVFILLPVIDSPPQPETLRTSEVLVLGIGTTLGIVVQAAGLWPAMRKVGFRWKWRWDWRQLHLRELARLSGWMLAYVVISQIGLFVVLRLANLAASNAGAPGPMVFNNAYLIFMMAHGIVAVSIITALMPRMAAAAAEGRHEDLKAHLSLGIRLSAVVLIPITVLYLVLGRPLAVVLFQYGAYSPSDAIATGWVIAVAAIGLVPFSIAQLQIFAFYAMPDTRTPTLLNIPVVAVRIAVDVLLYLVLPATWVAAGLMFGNAVSFALSVVIGYWLLRKRVGRLGLTRDIASLARQTAAAVIAAVPTALLAWLLIETMGSNWIASLVQLIVCGGLLLVVYVAAAFLLRVAEVREVATSLRARIGR
ncbi:murein biosynthesis integral membrane protein MurJ [Luedemannella helvata]|uniref:Murein biosynthesis integral membrane protein MurJ n=1 Tax=Luedemannella helvata TaxID=349315 RepID=A0ABP4X791_9ACTN